MNNIALYFHVPFCVKKCDYCAFYSLASQGDDIKEAYCDALLRQLSFFSTEKAVTSVYFGGGTPPLLGIDRLCKLLSAIKSKFVLTDDCEITIEVNPKTVDLGGLAKLREVGFNRLSVGVQSADDEILASIGRIHSFSDAVECIDNAKAAGFENISADIIFALPSLTAEKLKDSVIKIMSTNVSHISAYSLQLEEGTPLYNRRKSLSLPTEDAEEEQYNLICDTLKANGFEHYEISSFAKRGKRSRHNLNYWACGEYFGFGAGAHSYYNGRRFSAKPCIDSFIESASISLFEPTDYDSSPVITEQEIEEERIMLGLRTSDGIIIPKRLSSTAQNIASMGLADFDGERIILNSKGFRLSNSIIRLFI